MIHTLTIVYLGKPTDICITEDANAMEATLSFQGDILLLVTKNNHLDSIKIDLKRLLIKDLKHRVDAIIKEHMQAFKQKPKRIQIVDSFNKWGSCNSQRIITFNWKLISLPPYIIEYIVVHELCHLVHLNHDRSFWRLVGKHFPDYKKAEEWLTNHS